MSEKDMAEVAKLRSETLANKGKFFAAVVAIPVAIAGSFYEYNEYLTREKNRLFEMQKQAIEQRRLDLTSQTLNIFGQLADDLAGNDIQAAYLLRGLEMPALPYIAGAIGHDHPAQLKQSFFESFLAIASASTVKLGTTETIPNAPEAARILTVALDRNWHAFLQDSRNPPNPEKALFPYIDLVELWLSDFVLKKETLTSYARFPALLRNINSQLVLGEGACGFLYISECRTLANRIAAVLATLYPEEQSRDADAAPESPGETGGDDR